MNKKIQTGRLIVAVAVVFCVALYSASFAKEETKIPDRKTCGNPFKVVVDVRDASSAGLIADAQVKQFTVSVKEGVPNERYDLYFYRGDVLRMSKQDVGLPFAFKRTFRAVSPGDHKIHIVLKKGDGSCSIGSANIKVKSK